MAELPSDLAALPPISQGKKKKAGTSSIKNWGGKEIIIGKTNTTFPEKGRERKRTWPKRSSLIFSSR